MDGATHLRGADVKLTAFLGSPRPQGNTDLLTAAVLEGAAEVGLETNAIALRSKRVRPCVACERCWQNGRPCALDDDMSELYQAIGEADVLLFATPVYWYAPTAQMKAFLDRLVPLNRPQGRALVEGKGALLVTAYEEEGPTAAEPLLRMFELSFAYLGLRDLGRVVVPGVGPKGAVRERPEALAEARALGRALGERGSR
jgi:multimeric flavodoxin WrbA